MIQAAWWKAFGYLVALVGMVLVIALLVLAANGYHVGRAIVELVRPDPDPVANNPELETVHARVSWVGDIQDMSISESSGLTASPQHPGIFWTLNDSGDEAKLYAFDLGGSTQAVLSLNNGENFDWEALDAFRAADGRSYLLVGDVGDNLQWRPHVMLYVVPEPEALTDQRISAHRVMRVVYEGGPLDVEALAYDAVRSRVLLLGKRQHPPMMYSVDLPSTDPSEWPAEARGVPIGVLEDMPLMTELDRKQNPRSGAHLHRPTGMDIHGDSLVVTTLRHAYLFDLDADVLRPRLIALPQVGQREAITFAADRGSEIYVSRERARYVGVADLFVARLIEPAADHDPRAEPSTPEAASVTDP